MAESRLSIIRAYRNDERAFIASFAVIAALAVLLGVFSRAPAAVGKLGFASLDAIINVGYVVAFGPFILAVLTIWKWVESRRVREHRISAKIEHATTNPEIFIFLVLYLVPGLGCFFLLWQYIWKTTDPNTLCDQFDHWRLFTDWSLFGWHPAYCFGNVDAQLMPYMYPPIQTWVAVVAAVLTLILGSKIWRNMCAE